jgi:hypothetical protein
MNPFMWLNNLWVITPVLIGLYPVRGELNRFIVIALYVVAALLLHSAIAHSAEALLEEWEADDVTPRPRGDDSAA